jgi:hypothetical protein
MNPEEMWKWTWAKEEEESEGGRREEGMMMMVDGNGNPYVK